MNIFKRFSVLLTILFLGTTIFANPFNDKLTSEEQVQLSNGEVLIRNINYPKYMCLADGTNQMADNLIASIKSLNPKYLAEVIQIKPYAGNEDLPQKLEQLLLNVSDYAGIPYWSERHECYFDLYSSAEIKQIENKGDKINIKADLEMSPFGLVHENIEISKSADSIFYFTENTNTLSYHDQFKCVYANKMNMDILLFRDGENWVLYGIGGVNAPRIPFFTERIETSFINRIKTFCNFIFNKLSEEA